MKRRCLGGVLACLMWFLAPSALADPVIWEYGFEEPFPLAIIQSGQSFMRIESSLAPDGDWYGNVVGPVGDPAGETMTIAFSTTGFTSLVFEGLWKVHGGLEGGDEFSIWFSPNGGSSWQNLATLANTPAGEWEHFHFPLPPDGDDNPDTQLRLFANFNSGSDRVLIDTLSVRVVPEPTTAATLVMGAIALAAARRRIWTG